MPITDSGLRGLGSRHINDKAPFKLWNEDEYEFRGDRRMFEWIIETFPGTEAISSGDVTLHVMTTSIPPADQAPITVGGVATFFTEPIPIDSPRHTFFQPPNTRYASFGRPVRVPDPIPAETCRVQRWVKPTPDQLEIIPNTLCDLADVKTLTFIDVFLMVELRADNERTYKDYSLPREVAGIITFYHHSNEPYWKDLIDADERDKLIVDRDMTANRLAEKGHIFPGVRLSSSPHPPATAEGEQVTTTTKNSTAGVLLRNSNTGQLRVTAASQSFPESDPPEIIYHQGTRIGVIDSRLHEQDMALIQLDPSIKFTNQEYFNANPPKRLLRSTEIPRGTWFAVDDGTSTGKVYLQARGERFHLPRRSAGEKLKFGDFEQERIFGASRPMSDEWLGAPIVQEDPEGAGLAGFVNEMMMLDGEYCVAKALDGLIDSGWNLA